MGNPYLVLVVDDSRVVRMTMERLLSKAGVPPDNVASVGSAAEATEHVDRSRPDLVFMDIDMPGVDGEQAAMAIMEKDPTVKVVVVSSLDREDDRVSRVIGQGAFDFIRKPVRLEALENVFRLMAEDRLGMGRIH